MARVFKKKDDKKNNNSSRQLFKRRKFCRFTAEKIASGLQGYQHPQGICFRKRN